MKKIIFALFLLTFSLSFSNSDRVSSSLVSKNFIIFWICTSKIFLFLISDLIVYSLLFRFFIKS